MPPASSKGKGRAVEQTPLLDRDGNLTSETSEALSPQTASSSQSAAASRPSMRQAWRSHALTAALALLTLFFGLLLGILLLTKSYAAPAWQNIERALSHSGQDSDNFWKEAVALRGPDAVNVVSIDRSKDELGVMRLEVNISVTMRMAVDTDFIMGFREDGAPDDGWWKRKWKELGRWGVRQLGSTTATAHVITIYPSSSSATEPLVTLKPLSPIAIPLSPGLSAQDHHSSSLSLSSVSIPLIIHPSQNTSLLIPFLKQSWVQGFFSVRIHGASVLVHGGHEYSNPPYWWELRRWRNWLKIEKDEVMLDIKMPIPPFHIPSHPPSHPGSELPALAELLTLESFNITSAPSPPNSPQPFPTSPIQGSPSNDPRRTNIDAARAQSLLTHDKSSSPLADGLSPSRLHKSPTDWNLLIFAHASVAHPFSKIAPKLDLGKGLYALPFTIALPLPLDRNNTPIVPSSVEQNGSEIIPVAQVYASPTFNATHIHIPLSGYVLPLSNTSSHLSDAISAFVSSYLSYKPSTIAIFSPLYPSMVVRALFPPPPDKLELLRNVTIENMSIHPGMGSIFLPNSGGGAAVPSVDTALTALEILASATVHARVVLPAGMNVDIRVARVWLDCFVFDGEVPPAVTSLYAERGSSIITTPTNTAGEDGTGPSVQEDPPVPEPRPLPTPLPERAFARITPKNWMNATSSSVPPQGKNSDTHQSTDIGVESDTGTNVYVTAELVDVPLEVLPGRQGDLSSFVTKVLFSKEPVVAGIRGVAAVRVSVPGLTNPASSGSRVEGSELILTGLPFEGNVRVGGRKF